ncbi:MAG: STAS domain-containing protein [Fibrobacterales bacterium]
MGSDLYKYRCTENALELKLCGDLKYFKSFCFDQFLEETFTEKPLPHITIDLSDANFIDSTNLGLIAKIARLHDAQFDEKVIILSPNESIHQVLLSMGFDQVFDIKLVSEPLAGEFQDVPEEKAELEHFQDTIYKSHKLLSEMNQKNRETFKGVVESMERRRKGPQ